MPPLESLTASPTQSASGEQHVAQGRRKSPRIFIARCRYGDGRSGELPRQEARRPVFHPKDGTPGCTMEATDLLITKKILSSRTVSCSASVATNVSSMRNSTRRALAPNCCRMPKASSASGMAFGGQGGGWSSEIRHCPFHLYHR